MIGEINRNQKLEYAKQNQYDENYLSTGNEGNNGFSSDENINSKHKLMNLKEEKKRYTKPAIVRLEFKTRYNSSKKVIAYFNTFKAKQILLILILNYSLMLDTTW